MRGRSHRAGIGRGARLAVVLAAGVLMATLSASSGAATHPHGAGAPSEFGYRFVPLHQMK